MHQKMFKDSAFTDLLSHSYPANLVQTQPAGSGPHLVRSRIFLIRQAFHIAQDPVQPQFTRRQLIN